MFKIYYQKGTALLIGILTMGIMLLLATYFLSFGLTESKIAKSQEDATKTYYLAEAGINHAIWKLKNDNTDADGDDAWETCFVTSTAICLDCNNWTETIVKDTDELVANSNVTITIQNSECGRASITATSTIDLGGGKTAQRVVETSVYKPIVGPTNGAAVFSGGTSENVSISGSMLRVYGNIFSNNNLTVNWWSTVEVYDSTSTVAIEGKIFAVQNYNLSWTSVASASAECAKNLCNSTTTCRCIEESEKFQECEENQCRANSASAPLVDFDSASVNSFKSRAQTAEVLGNCENLCNGAVCMCDGSPCNGNNQCVIDDDDFEDLLWAAGENGTLTLNSNTKPEIVYVTGSVEFRGGRRVVVNGSLVADGTIAIGERYSWVRGGDRDEGFSHITVNRPTSTTTSGILTKSKINFGLYSSFAPIEITGVVYASDEIRFVSMPQEFTLIGGAIARKLSFSSVWQWFNFILDDEVVLYGLGYKIDGVDIDPEFSPIITIDHWEEAY